MPTETRKMNQKNTYRPPEPSELLHLATSENPVAPAPSPCIVPAVILCQRRYSRVERVECITPLRAQATKNREKTFHSPWVARCGRHSLRAENPGIAACRNRHDPRSV